MIFRETRLAGAYEIVPERRVDDRGMFARTFCRREFEAHGLNPDVLQCNLSHNRRKGTLRGIHYQIAPHEEAKLIRCSRGAIYDVIVDLRPASQTFCQWIGVELRSEADGLSPMLYVPAGFGHGFLTLEDDSDVYYQMSAFYAPDAQRGYRWNDPAFGIEWPGVIEVIAERDRTYPDFARPQSEARS